MVRKFFQKVALAKGKKVSVFTYFRVWETHWLQNIPKTTQSDLINDSASHEKIKFLEKISWEILKKFSQEGGIPETWKHHRQNKGIKYSQKQ